MSIRFFALAAALNLSPAVFGQSSNTDHSTHHPALHPVHWLLRLPARVR